MARNVNDIIKSLPANRRRKITKRAARLSAGIASVDVRTPNGPTRKAPKK
jgi:hypothetical protein